MVVVGLMSVDMVGFVTDVVVVVGVAMVEVVMVGLMSVGMGGFVTDVVVVVVGVAVVEVVIDGDGGVMIDGGGGFDECGCGWVFSGVANQ